MIDSNEIKRLFQWESALADEDLILTALGSWGVDDHVREFIDLTNRLIRQLECGLGEVGGAEPIPNAEDHADGCRHESRRLDFQNLDLPFDGDDDHARI